MAQAITLGRRQAGFGYIGVLFIALVLAIFAGTAYEQLETIVRRDKEQDWLFAGKQYQQAIERYYHQSPNGLKELPKTVDDLVRDTRFLKTKHHLRKPYLDPITGQDWLLILNEQGQLNGVVSRSNAPILQTAILLKLDNMEHNQGLISVYADVQYLFKPINESTKGEDDINEAAANEQADNATLGNPAETEVAPSTNSEVAPSTN